MLGGLQASAGDLHRPQHGLRFVDRFLEFFRRVGVRDDARSRLQVCVFAFHQHGADGDAGIQVAGEIRIQD